ncbi:S-adenosyl-L-methionine-dependent methyltransferase [Multifurca ochricompacta]|uniref:S-adenosyl-L-methionine-dependent methyltransferase n=1 Tax=Multifurca ochricompacta TaxID=376703 RepID=A0AAD4M0N5_9AGAM|nr:S-adenosyl-L-methionine-dependent methyltransferase [Multifurca ochricompacta]
MNFYFDAAKIIDHLDAKHGSVKSLLSTVPEKNRKRTAALVIETLKYKSALAEVIAAADLLKAEKKINSNALALVLVHDLLLSSGIQAGDGPVKQALIRHKTRLHSELQRVKIRRGAKSDSELALPDAVLAVRIPRYVRINTLKWSIHEAVKTFQNGGYTLGNPLDQKLKFARDAHIENLLLFPPEAQLTDTPEYSDGRLILQDKASCFPAIVLSPPAHPTGAIIDATAAPGNKTSHLSALMGNQGKIFAFERDRKRYDTLKTMLARAGCNNVEALNVDFLTTDYNNEKYSRVTHILLDPSCSGSGIINRLDHLMESEGAGSNVAHTERLAKLAAFQLQMLRHAMKYPAVEKIVYSTCSVHPEENEQVVDAALRSTEATAGGFRLATHAEVLPTWSRRGQPGILSDEGDTEAVVRCSPDDATNGFFVSCFVRRHGRRSTISEAEPPITGRNKALGVRPVTVSAKRKAHTETMGTAPPHRHDRPGKEKGRNEI